MFECISTLEGLTFRADNKKKFVSINFRDSIFQNFPIATLVMDDAGGEIHDSLYFIENLDFYIQFGNQASGFISHNFTWSENQISGGSAGDSVNGKHIFVLLSDFFNQDEVKTKSFKGEPSTIVESIIKNYRFPGTKSKYLSEADKYKLINISKTKSDDIWYQSNQTDFNFIDQIGNYSLPRNQTGNDNSPFLSFVNIRGEFYFKDLWSLYQQQPVKEMYLSNDPERNMDPQAMTHYRMEFLGAPSNYKNYHKNVYRINAAGDFIVKTTKLEDYFIQFQGDKSVAPLKIPIQRGTQNHLTDIAMMGIEEDDRDRRAYQALLNTYYLNSLTAYRLVVMVDYDSALATGKTVKITNIKSKVENKLFNWEYIGNWLIIESSLMYHISDAKAKPMLNLTLSRPAVNVYQKHPLIKEFIGAK